MSHPGSAGRGGEIVPGRCGETCSARVDKHQWLGWLGVIVAVLFLGSTYVVVKQFDSGDGKVCTVYNHNGPHFLAVGRPVVCKYTWTSVRRRELLLIYRRGYEPVTMLVGQ